MILLDLKEDSGYGLREHPNLGSSMEMEWYVYTTSGGVYSGDLTPAITYTDVRPAWKGMIDYIDTVLKEGIDYQIHMANHYIEEVEKKHGENLRLKFQKHPITSIRAYRMVIYKVRPFKQVQGDRDKVVSVSNYCYHPYTAKAVKDEGRYLTAVTSNVPPAYAD